MLRSALYACYATSIIAQIVTNISALPSADNQNLIRQITSIYMPHTIYLFSRPGVSCALTDKSLFWPAPRLAVELRRIDHTSLHE